MQKLLKARPGSAGALVVLVSVAVFLVCSAAASGSVQVACGDTLTTNTKLASDLYCSDGGLLLADGVTLDLNGHTLSGQGSGVRGASDGARFTVARGTITGFGVGVSPSTGGVATVNNVRITGALFGVDAVDGGAVVNNSVIANSHYGVAATLGSVEINHSAVVNNGVGVHAVQLGLAIRDSLIAGNDGDGVNSLDQVVVITNSVFTGNGGYGVWIFGLGQDPHGATLIGNIANRNGFDGVFLSALTPFPPNPWYVAHNTANQNHSYGIEIDNLAGAIVDYDKGGNVARGNGQPAQCLNITCA